MAYEQTPQDHRRKWDKDEFEKLAKDRIETEKELELGAEEKIPHVKKTLLKPREYRVDLESRLGKTTVITQTTPIAQSGGYYCNACDCVVKDSINFLDHINGKKHQRNLGMSMRVERSTLDQVKERFEFNKKKKDEKKKEYDLEQRLQELKDEEEKLKEYRRDKKKEKKRKAQEAELEGIDTDMAATMGFSGFGSKKKK